MPCELAALLLARIPALKRAWDLPLVRPTPFPVARPLPLMTNMFEA